jgi:hypothetical protein
MDLGEKHFQQPPESLRPPAATAANKSAEYLMNGCLVTVGCVLALSLMANCIFAMIGLFTGHLYLLGRRGRPLTVHGPWARVISGVVLMIGVFVVLRVLNLRKKGRN